MGVNMSFMRYKSSRMLPILVLVAGACFGSGWILAEVADSLSAGEARVLLQHIGGADFKKNQIQIKKIGSGIGDGAIVDAQIETAFRFVHEGRDWKVAEIRLGDRQWESLELLDEAVRREKTRRTVAVLEKVAGSLDAYRRAKGAYVVAEEFVKLLDELAPGYVSPIVELDLWGTPLRYRGAAAAYRLASAGPDRVPDTPDDLVLENGVLKAIAYATPR